MIRKLINVEFHHVRTDENPADIATRGMAGDEIAGCSMWWNGPTWLSRDRTDWPTDSVIDAISDTGLRAIANESENPTVLHSFLAAEGVHEPITRPPSPFGIDPASQSSFRTLLRVTCWCLKFFKTKIWDLLAFETRQKHIQIGRLMSAMSSTATITAKELTESQLMWITAVQQYRFGDVHDALRTGKKNQLVNQLNICIDEDGRLRCYGRLKHADLTSEAIEPLLLPKDDRITELIIKQTHEQLFHAGISHTLSQLRRQFWIPHGRNAVRKCITKCRVCRRLKGPPFALPNMPPWPRERVSKSAPFQFTGVDYMGPINVAYQDTTHKMWVCLFTCLATRAIHLEHVTNCTAQSFIDCISRFVARRGSPEQIISDNAPQFRLAKTLFDRTWQSVLTDPLALSYIAEKNIIWKFTAELAPWQGGFYERLVGLVKNSIRMSVGRKLLQWEQFVTLLAEVEAIVNSRPITYVYSDIRSGLALRPMDFLVDRPVGTPEVDPTIPPEGGEASKYLLKYWKSKQRRLDSLWRQWYDDYLLSMRERWQVKHRRGRSDIDAHPQMNEVVLVKNTDGPRGTWKLGRVTRLIPGRDGSIRSAELVLPNRLTIRRAINHLYPLEVPSSLSVAIYPDADVGIIEQVNAEKMPGDRQVDGNMRFDTVDDEPFEGFEADEVDQPLPGLVLLVAKGRKSLRDRMVESPTTMMF